MDTTVLFRTDASPEIGGGHVMRCLTLADHLKSLGCECRFLSSAETLSSMPVLVSKGYEVHDPSTLPEQTADILVFDHYGIDKTEEERCRRNIRRIVVIDDLADRSHECDILMDHTYGRKKQDYKPLVPSACAILTGAEYALLRPQFAEKRAESLKRREECSGEIKRVLLMISTADEHNITGFVLNALEGLQTELSIDVVVGANAPHAEAVRQQAKQSAHECRMHQNVEDVASLMCETDLAIGAGGTASWERCALGLPTVAIEIADNQHTVLKQLEKANALLNMGRHEKLQKDKFLKAMEQLLSDPQKVSSMGKAAAGICDGLGTQRVAEKILEGLR